MDLCYTSRNYTGDIHNDNYNVYKSLMIAIKTVPFMERSVLL